MDFSNFKTAKTAFSLAGLCVEINGKARPRQGRWLDDGSKAESIWPASKSH
jgi:hypothetical protein